MKINLATWFTILRLLILPFLIVVLVSNVFTTRIYISNQYIDVKYFIGGVLFIVGSLTDFIDGYIARKYDQVTDLGKFLDPIADKLLVNSTVIILISSSLLSPLVGIIFIGRDTIVDVIRMIAASKGNVLAASSYGKLKTIFQMLGITSVLFYNLPFEIINIPISDVLIYAATFFSIFSGIDYYLLNKHLLFDSEQEENDL